MSRKRDQPGPAKPGKLDAEGRYQDLGLIARGGMGEVRRVRDRRMNRVLAMKLLRWELLDEPASQTAFLHEARISAQLQHPAIVPVHDQGRLADGRPWFTMKEVVGRTFADWIEALHALPMEAQTAELRRIVAALLRACEAVAYAHRRAIVHRDLKPQNLMVGDFGEVLVMDWGIACHGDDIGVGQAVAAAQQSAAELDRTPSPMSLDDLDATPGPMRLDDLDATPGPMSLDQLDAQVTLAHQATLAADSGTPSSAGSSGQPQGTLAYMAPEQARGEPASPMADVYCLGGVLYTIMAGHAPYRGSTAKVWAQLSKRPPPPLDGMAASPLRPAALCEIAGRALAREPAQRYRDAGAMAAAINDWLDGTARRQRALSLVTEADRLLPAMKQLRRQAQRLQQQADQQLGALPLHAPIADKAPGWALQDRGRALQDRAALQEVGWLQTLRAALSEEPELPEAHQRLADHYRERVEEAERRRDQQSAVQHEALLRAHDRGRHAAYLRGDAKLTLLTEPPGAQVTLFRYVEHERALQLRHVRTLGSTPLCEVPLARGSYQLVVRAAGYEALRYPLLIERGRDWSGVRPGDSEPTAVRLLRLGELGPGECHVPGGWFVAGGDPMAGESLPRRWLWADDFVMRRDPVSNAEYLQFLNALMASGQLERAMWAAPREPRGRGGGKDASSLFHFDERAGFQLVAADGQEAMRPDHPVVCVPWLAAMAYARWRAERDGVPWRLPNELEWEKAARGTDGRFMPWGDHVEPTRACIVQSRPGDPSLQPVGAYPSDVSPYGVRGMVGNARDWCINTWKAEGPATGGGVDDDFSSGSAHDLDGGMASGPGEPGGDGAEGRLVLPDAAADDDPEIRAVRGGCWFSTARFCRLATRFATKPDDWLHGLSFRLLRSV